MTSGSRRASLWGALLLGLLLPVLGHVVSAWAAQTEGTAAYGIPGRPPEGQPADVSGAEEEQAVAQGSRAGRTPNRQGAVPPPASSPLNPAHPPPAKPEAPAREHPGPEGTRYVDDVVCGAAEGSCQASTRVPSQGASRPADSPLTAMARWIADPMLYGIVTLVGILVIGALFTLEPALRKRGGPQRRR